MKQDEINLEIVSHHKNKSYGLKLLGEGLPEVPMEYYSNYFFREIYKYFSYKNELQKRIKIFERETGMRFKIINMYETTDLYNTRILVVEFKLLPQSLIRKFVTKLF